jgi:hypothetical protein
MNLLLRNRRGQDRRLGPVGRIALTLIVMASFAVADRPAQAARGQLHLTVTDADTGEVLPCRMHLKNAAGRPQKVPKTPFWRDHFVFPGEITLKLSKGAYTFEIERGPEYTNVRGHFIIEDFADDSKTVELHRAVDMAASGWWSGDLHVHRSPKEIEDLMRAEDLHVAPLITWWNKENPWARASLPEEPLVRFDENRFYHLMAGEDEREGGALLFFNLDEPLDIASAQRHWPSSMEFLLEARKHDGVWIDVEKPFWWDVPLWLASGNVDSIGLANNHMQRSGMLANEAWGKPRDRQALPDPWGNGLWSQQIYYHVLNAGLRIPPSAGSASGVLPNPLGYNRMYVHVDGEFSYADWWKNFKAGRVVVTNGPVIRPRVNGELPGYVFHGDAEEELELEIQVDLATRDPVSYLEVIKNGNVEQSVRIDEWAKDGKLPTLKFAESGWFLIRVVTEVRETYRFASTGPYYVEIGDTGPRVSRKSVEFFLDWISALGQHIKLPPGTQRDEVLSFHGPARAFWKEKLEAANAE